MIPQHLRWIERAASLSDVTCHFNDMFYPTRSIDFEDLYIHIFPVIFSATPNLFCPF